MACSCSVIEKSLIKGLLTTMWARFQNETREGTVFHRRKNNKKKNCTPITTPRPDIGLLFPERTVLRGLM